LIGDLGLLETVCTQLEIHAKLSVLESPRLAQGQHGIVEIVDMKNVDIDQLRVGCISGTSGKASIEYIQLAVSLAKRNEIDSMVTGPINKKSINLAGSRFIGHTEMIADLCGVKEPLTMFWVRGAKIFFLTRHLSLVEAVKAVTKDLIVTTVLAIIKELERIGINKPVIAVAALNPHAGDEGLIGFEEQEEIIPAIEGLRKRGLNVVGPVPADSVFHNALMGKYDAVLSLYHDQGHIASKTVDFYGTVSVTLGLPFIRTSVDHGTAFDIAGKGLANCRSMEEAILTAAKLTSKTLASS
jgi:4-hydroxythreonine-4-phosphate dehydrogenase